jgi:hypothetical protein
MSLSASSKAVSAAFELISRCSHVEERYVFELLGAIARAKPVVRLHLENLEEYAALEVFARRTGLSCAHAKTRSKLVWSNTIGDSFFTTVDWNDPAGTAFAAYVAADHSALEAAVEVEAGGTALDSGRLLGYPHCCCEAYARLEQGEFWISALAAASPLISYPFWGNKYAYLLHGASLFPDYFPCSLGCEGTHRLGRILAEVARSFGLNDLVARYESLMRKPVLLADGAIRSGCETYEWQGGAVSTLPEAEAAAAAISRHDSWIELPSGARVRILYFE